MTDHACQMPGHGRPDAPHACCRPAPAPTIAVPGLWRRSALNTAHCLLGCAIGDVAAMTLVPLVWPAVSMPLLMAIAIACGLATSLALETLLLRFREAMAWRSALRTALGMSLLSMVLMEAVMNLADWLVMGGQRLHWHDPRFWLAWGPALLAGFLAAWPYNHAMLRRHGRSCH